MGTEVIGVDVARPLSRDFHRLLEDAFNTSKLLCFRDQLLTTDSLVAFARTWGPKGQRSMPRKSWDEIGDVSIASNADENGRPNGRPLDPMAMRWHTDRSLAGDPVAATLLYGLEVPSQGGETIFADTAIAYEALPQALTQTMVATEPELVYRHQWRRRDLLMWDGRGMLHRDMPFDTTRELRTMFRTVVVDMSTH